MSEKTTPPPGRPGYVRKLVHELKSPLSAIAAAAEVMRDEQLGPIGDERYLAYATDIHNSATHLLELVDRLLAQRSDGGVPAMSFTDLDVEELIAGIASQMLPLAKRAGVTLVTGEGPDARPDARLPAIVADATSLRQILINLVTNAIKFTPAEGRVALYAGHAPGHPLIISVVDDGVGMAQEAVEAALDGNIVPAAGVRSDRGLGLGLPLVQSLATLNGASIEFDTHPGRGMRVSIIFPTSRLVLR